MVAKERKKNEAEYEMKKQMEQVTQAVTKKPEDKTHHINIKEHNRSNQSSHEADQRQNSVVKLKAIARRQSIEVQPISLKIRPAKERESILKSVHGFDGAISEDSYYEDDFDQSNESLGEDNPLTRALNQSVSFPRINQTSKKLSR